MRTLHVLSGLIAVTCSLPSLVNSACIPDFTQRLLSDPDVISHPSLTDAFKEAEKYMSSLFVNTTRDGLSFAVVSTSYPTNR